MAVEAHGFGSLDPFLPTDPIVLVKEINAVVVPQFLTQFADQFMVLIAGIEQACGECIMSGSCSIFCGLLEARLIAIGAAASRFRGNLGQEVFKQVLVFVDDLEVAGRREIFYRLQTTTIFLVRVDVVIEKIADDIVLGFTQDADWIDGAIGTTNMQQNVHKTNLYSVAVGLFEPNGLICSWFINSPTAT